MLVVKRVDTFLLLRFLMTRRPIRFSIVRLAHRGNKHVALRGNSYGQPLFSCSQDLKRLLPVGCENKTLYTFVGSPSLSKKAWFLLFASDKSLSNEMTSI